MLRELHISGLGVIDDLDLELHPGLNVLTGETGAGKTMVTVGLALALGTRADSSLVRDGAKAARVQARFDATEGAVEWAEDGEVLLARSVNADGKSSARVGGQLATASTLAELGSALVEVHGQHQAQRLLSSTTQTGFLDRFAGEAHLVALAAYREAWERWRDARSALEALEASTRERERELDLLAYQVNEIEAVDPSDGETERLTVEEARLAHVERLLERSTEAEETLAGDASLGDAAASAANALAEAARLDPRAEGLAERSRSLATELAELARDVRGYREGLAADPARLQELRERLSVLERAATQVRGHGGRRALVPPGGVVPALDARHGRRAPRGADRGSRTGPSGPGGPGGASSPRAGPTRRRRWRRRSRSSCSSSGCPAPRSRSSWIRHPRSGRREPRSSSSVSRRRRARRRRRSAKTASGGELSRTMLACRSVMADLDDVPTLVFDEVDAGIGGEAGLAVGRRLARLAEGRQVLVVTHLPQIACFADRHILVEKDAGTATVRPLSDDERVHELSRMLAGLTGSDGAVTHAEELLATASASRGASAP